MSAEASDQNQRYDLPWHVDPSLWATAVLER